MDAAQEPATGAIVELIRRFLGHVRRRGAASTAETYGYQLHPLRRFLEAHGVTAIDQLREQHLEEWQDELEARHLAPKSRALAATAARSWLRWAIERDFADWRLLRAVTSVRIPRGRARPIPREDLVRVIDSVGPLRPRMELRDLRDRALFFYVLVTGARVSEVLQVRRERFHDQVIVQKGGEEKRLRVPPTVAEMVHDYLARRTDDLPWLWISMERGRPARRLTKEAANLAWRRMARRLGLGRWTTHRLRDTSATFLALKQLPTHLIAKHLGHADLRTVTKYIEIAEEQRAQVLELMEELVRDAPRPPLRRGVRLRGRTDRRPRG